MTVELLSNRSCNRGLILINQLEMHGDTTRIPPTSCPGFSVLAEFHPSVPKFLPVSHSIIAGTDRSWDFRNELIIPKR